MFVYRNLGQKHPFNMARNKKRKGHPYRKPSLTTTRQRAKGSTLWSILFAVFALLIGFFAAGPNYTVLVIAGITGAIVGFFIGKSMEAQP
jgi:hypothetical protein